MANPPPREHKLTAAARALAESRTPPGAPLVVGLSGGMDSVSLLDAISPLADRRPILACHVNHGVSPRADIWERFCRELCAAYGVRIFVRRVDGEIAAGGMTEQRARRERMRAFADLPAAAIVVAHHADDQAETVLFRMLRGTGAYGMGAMRACAPLPGAAERTLLRPWLEIPRAEIADYARRRRLRWVEDEDNRNVARRRNFLRHRAMPVLREYFPDSGRTLSAAACRFGDAAALLGELADEDDRRAGGGEDGGRELAYFQEKGAARLRNWLHIRLSGDGARFGERGLAEAARQILACRGELSLPFAGRTLRVWRGRLYADTLPPPPESFRQIVDPRRGRLEMPQIGGALVSRRVPDGGLCGRKIAGGLVARLRRGGERLYISGRARAVSDLLRAAEMAPWLRRRLPLLFAGDTLAAVPGVAVAAEFRAENGETGVEYTMEWR
ncbi:MAG: tRNA lysidine(34) synthetase TilS [Gammaproteobacteria bacterium]